MARPPASGLSPLESRLMDLVWRDGRVTAEQITQALGGGLTNASVRTLLRRMEAKGFLTHQTEGRTFVYTPRMNREEAGRTAIARVAQRFYRGSVEQLLLGLVEARMVDARVLDRLSRKIADAETSRASPRKRR